MKKKLFFATALIIFAVGFVFAQEKIEKYCEVSFRGGLFHKVWIDFGSRGISFKDSLITQNLAAVKSLKNAVDILDDMNKIGWRLESSLYDHYSGKTIFYFKKTFDKSEFVIDDNN
jgi:hypothetical protein